MVLLGGIFPGDSVKACRVQELVLVLVFVVADFTAGGRCLPAVRADGLPVFLVVAVTLRNVVFLVHEGIVEQPEFESEQSLVAGDGGVVFIGGVNGNAPRCFMEKRVEVLQECALVILAGEVRIQLERCAVDVVFGPVPETGLHEGDTRIRVVFGREVGVELLVEPLEFFVFPVGVVGGAVSAGVLVERLGIGLVGLDVQGDCGGALHAFGTVRGVFDGLARVLDAETHDGLVPAALDVVEHLFETAPVVVDFAVSLACHHGAGETVRELERNGALQILLLFRLVGPEHDSLHGLERFDALVERDGTVGRERGCGQGD